MDTTNNEQTYLLSGQTTELIEASGLWYNDALLNNSNNKPIRWVSDSYLTPQDSDNASTIITYSFPGLDGPTVHDELGEIVSTPFSSQQILDIRLALEEVSKYINVTFVEVNEVDEKVGTLRLAIKTIYD